MPRREHEMRQHGSVAPDLGAAMFAPQVLREYALLADGERGALVGSQGECAWMCAPHWDSPAVFAALIGGPGGYAVTPTARFVWGGYYEDGTLIWHSRWVTDDGIVECREALAFPGDPHRAVLLRRVLAVEGDARVRIALDVRTGFGRYQMSDVKCDDGVWSARSGPLRLRWAGAPGAERTDAGTLEQTITVPAGSSHDLVLEVSEQKLPGLASAEMLWGETEHAWSAVVPDIGAPAAPADARHAYAVLRGLTSASGGMVAAATMSLPERAEQGRNYDYRYVWIRDQCYTGQAIAASGPHPLLDDAVRFVADRLLEDGPDLRPAYTASGGRVPSEEALTLPGYPGGAVKTGNWVNGQFQLDAFGESLLLLSAAGRQERLETRHWRAIGQAAQGIERRWTEPDAGVWELHDGHWAHSRLICAAGLRGAAGIAPRRGSRRGGDRAAAGIAPRRGSRRGGDRAAV